MDPRSVTLSPRPLTTDDVIGTCRLIEPAYMEAVLPFRLFVAVGGASIVMGDTDL